MSEDAFSAEIGGQRFTITGRETIYLAITAVCLTVVGYMLWSATKDMLKKTDEQTIILIKRSDEQAAQITGQHNMMTEQHAALKEAVENLSEVMAEQNYIITLPNEKRERLNLAMPHSLRQKVGRDKP